MKNLKRRKILIVEDEPIVRDSLKEWLAEDGYDVEGVASGEEAIERIKKQDFGVIVLDLRLPGIDGLQVFEQAKELKRGTKGVIITAYASKETLEKAKKLGILDYLHKPFKVADLEKIVGRALGELEGKKIDEKHLWLRIGAASYRLCDRNYECNSCPLAQEVQDTFDTIALLTEEEVRGLQQSSSGQKFCRYGSVHMVHRNEPYLV